MSAIFLTANDWSQTPADSVIDANQFTITNLPLPVNNGDAVNKQYADSLAGGLNPSQWATFPAVQTVSMNGYKVADMGYPEFTSDATNKIYVDNTINAWASKPATSNVNMNSKNINNLATINANNMYILNTGTGDSLRIDDQASDTTYFKVDSEGRCGVATGSFALSDTLTVNGSIRLGDANLGAGHFKGVNVGWYVGNNTSYPLCTPQSHESGLYLKRISGNLIATQLWTADGVAPGGGVARLTVMPSSGNTGIGTEDPQAKLHILQTGTQDAFRVDDVVSDTTYFRIDADGRCGVNTGSAIPLSDIFNVYGAVRVREAIDAQEIRLSTTPESAYIQTNAQLRIGKIATPTHTLNINTDTMRVGIGSSAPSAKLHIINTEAVDCLRIDDQASDTTYFRIDENGRCGVNTGSTALTSALTISGAVDVMNNKITGVAIPTNSNDAANKEYVDSVSGGAPNTWSQYPATQTVNMNYQKISNVANPVDAYDVATRAYVDQQLIPVLPQTREYYVTGATTIDLTENFNYEDICITIHCTSNFSLSFTHETDNNLRGQKLIIFLTTDSSYTNTITINSPGGGTIALKNGTMSSCMYVCGLRSGANYWRLAYSVL